MEKDPQPLHVVHLTAELAPIAKVRPGTPPQLRRCGLGPCSTFSKTKFS